MTPSASSNGACSLGIVSDFNAQNLAVLLQKNAAPATVQCRQAPFGQAMSLLLNPAAEFWSSAFKAVVLWTSPASVIPGFQRVLSSESCSQDVLMAEVDAFASLVQNISQSVSTIFIPSWISPVAGRGLGPLELANNRGIANCLMRMNLRLADRFESDRRIVLLDAQQWICRAGAVAFNPRLWYLSKTPFSSTVFQEASQDILAALNGIQGRSRKVIILDLDNTLWGGIVGETGWQKLRIGGHDPTGEAYADFQRQLKRLRNRGILLAIVSKNEEKIALEALQQHPEMVLKLDDFAAWRINWQDKAQNIVELMAELNLGLDSAIFFDDTPFERARVKEALQEVLVPDLPADPMEYPSWLTQLRCFDTPFITNEDRSRADMYLADRRRKALQTEVKSLGDWLALLELEVKVELLNDENLERAAQLFNKTNQMNLSTRRFSPAQLAEWAQLPDHRLWTFRVADKFGDYGLCGIISLVREDSKARVLDFLLSCRVMGRGVEEAMLATAVQHAQSLGCEELYARFIPTPKNDPLSRWLQSQPQLAQDGTTFRLLMDEPVNPPRHVRIQMSHLHEAAAV
jgi:FkbH-like protein